MLRFGSYTFNAQVPQYTDYQPHIPIPPKKYAYRWKFVISCWSHVSSRPPTPNIVFIEGTEGGRDVGIRLEFTMFSVSITWRKTQKVGKLSVDKDPSKFSKQGKLFAAG